MIFEGDEINTNAVEYNATSVIPPDDRYVSYQVCQKNVNLKDTQSLIIRY